MTWADLAGWAGAVTLLGAYGAVSAGALSPVSARFQGLNAAGSVGLATVAAAHHAWPSLALNLAWLVVAAASAPRSAESSRPRDREGALG